MSGLYPTLYEGDSIQLNPQKRILKLSCCDCGLVHSIDFAVGHRQKLTIRLKRENKSTAMLRRHRRFRCRKRSSE